MTGYAARRRARIDAFLTGIDLDIVETSRALLETKSREKKRAQEAANGAEPAPIPLKKRGRPGEVTTSVEPAESAEPILRAQSKKRIRGQPRKDVEPESEPKWFNQRRGVVGAQGSI